jgi:hypothetical protein
MWIDGDSVASAELETRLPVPNWRLGSFVGAVHTSTRGELIIYIYLYLCIYKWELDILAVWCTQAAPENFPEHGVLRLRLSPGGAR